AGKSAAERYQSGDFNSDDIVDEIDFLLYNEAYRAANPGAAPLSLAIPEPAGAALALLAVAGVVMGRRHRLRMGAAVAIAGGAFFSAGTGETRAADLLAH